MKFAGINENLVLFLSKNDWRNAFYYSVIRVEVYQCYSAGFMRLLYSIE